MVKVHIRLLVLLIFVPAIVALLQFGGLHSRAQLQEAESVIQADVHEALRENTEVRVIIHLKHPPISPVLDTDAFIQSTAQRQANVLRDVTEADFTLTHQYDFAPALAGSITAEGIARIERQPDILTVSLDPVMSIALSESLALIGADHSELHPLGIDGTGIVVAVLDSGIDTDHPDLSDSIAGQQCYLDYALGYCIDDPRSAWYDPDNPAEDNNLVTYHGTHISGIITSNGVLAPKGVAPEAGIYAYKVLNEFGQGHVSDQLQALNDIFVTNQVDFVNISIELQQAFSPGNCPAFPANQAALQALREVNGVVVFAAAGNHGSKSGITYPACDPYVVSVGAVYDGNVAPAYCDVDVGATADQVACFSDSSSELDLLAPGSRILSTWAEPPYTKEEQGTSQASPHAAGVAALLKQAMPGLSPDQIIDRMKSSGKWVFDDDPAAQRWTARVDARVALLTNDNADFDGDGCKNGAEFGSDVTAGGQRNPLDPWDFYDVASPAGPVPDGVIDLLYDVLGVINHYSPAGGPPYDVQYDRGSIIGPASWNKDSPDGVIDLMNDILGVIQQQGHTCI